MDNNWRTQAACLGVNPDLFFPGRKPGTDTAEAAKNVCRTCPVTTECLDYAVTLKLNSGIWGGRTYNQRTGRTQIDRPKATLTTATRRRP